MLYRASDMGGITTEILTGFDEGLDAVARLRIDVFRCFPIRGPDDPRRPPDYRPLDEFWTKRHYRPLKGVTATCSSAEIGDDEDETDHMLQFWMKDL